MSTSPRELVWNQFLRLESEGLGTPVVLSASRMKFVLDRGHPAAGALSTRVDSSGFVLADDTGVWFHEPTPALVAAVPKDLLARRICSSTGLEFRCTALSPEDLVALFDAVLAVAADNSPGIPDPRTLAGLEDAALDHGFDLVLPRAGNWAAFASRHVPVRLWLGLDGDGNPVAALSRADLVPDDPGAQATPAVLALPGGAARAWTFPDQRALARFLGRVFLNARSLLAPVLAAAELPEATLPPLSAYERRVAVRVTEEHFREELFAYWDGHCAITGLAVPELLEAVHVKPPDDCATAGERLDVRNGLLLAPQLAAAFRAGFVTVAEDGEVVVSPALAGPDRTRLGLDAPLRLDRLADGLRPYLAWHREHVFRNGAGADPGPDRASETA